MRLEAVPLSLPVVVEPPEIRRTGAIELLSMLGGATGPYLFLVRDVPRSPFLASLRL